jgi:hypothetical protein
MFSAEPLTKDKAILRIAGLAIGVCFLAAARFYNPFEADLFVCQFKALTGVDCPTCGMSRSIHLLMHFQLSDALAYHPLSVVIVAALIVLLLKFTTELVVKKEITIRWEKLNHK